MMGVTTRQADMLEAIRRLTSDGVPPSYAQLRDELGLSSTSGVQRLLVGLRDRGLVDFKANCARSVRILGEMEGLERRSNADLIALRARIDAILKGRGH